VLLLPPAAACCFWASCSTYQKAQKFGDLSATKLMEALCARPHTSKALTDLLHNTK
jgi:hypothetical protein